MKSHHQYIDKDNHELNLVPLHMLLDHMDFLNMDLQTKLFRRNSFTQNLNELSDGHGNIVFEPLGHRQK
jgi:hypothetical protein